MNLCVACKKNFGFDNISLTVNACCTVFTCNKLITSHKRKKPLRTKSFLVILFYPFSDTQKVLVCKNKLLKFRNHYLEKS